MRIAKILLLFTVILSSISVANENMKVQFGEGKVTVELPALFDPPAITENGFLLKMDKKGRYTLEMTRLGAKEEVPKGFGPYAVMKMAEEKGLKASKVGDKVLMQEPFVQRGKGESGVKTINFSIGVGGSIVTMTLTTPPKGVMSDKMKALVNQTVNSAILTLTEL
ncbi:hypothetical protein SAMN02745866_04083 [Alteromonadaceae bacterium Bs31]|nr:hypothetical protein SAMN02745866_04083 [Alteromonadaceae bacterium Bs31]